MDATAPPPTPTSPENPLLELLEQALERAEVEGPAALEQLCREHPEHERGLRKRLEVLARSGLLPSALDKSMATATTRQLGDFRLLERIGEGGMGVVYVAEQISLPRKVAVKVVRPEQLFFSGARERFHREIDAIARLNHPGIVPIYSVGEQDGIPYYAMEIVAGASVAEILERARELPQFERTGAAWGRLARTARRAVTAEDDTEQNWLFDGSWSEVVCRIVQQVAQSLAHAHQRGVLHRDLKPSNIMVTSGGRVVLLDFGLASSSSAGAITKSGTLLGSVPYMSPEQASGAAKAIDARSDVYSLGATLYEMLALRPPFPQRETPALLQAIALGEFPALRTLNPAIPRDLETVCRTAMHSDPNRRYARAADFARDLDNVLTRRPIEARRVSAVEQCWRFVQRKPALAAALALATLVVIGGPLAYAGFERHARRKLDASQAATKEQRGRAEDHLRRVLRVASELLEPIRELDVEEDPRLTQMQREALERALAIFEGFSAEDFADPLLRREVARSEVDIANILWSLGRADESEVHFVRARDTLLQPFSAGEADAQGVEALAYARNQYAHWLRERARGDEAATELLAALAALEALPAPPTRSARTLTARVKAHLGMAGANNTGSAAKSADQYQKDAVAELRLLQAEAPKDVDILTELSEACLSIGRVGALTDGRAHVDEAISMLHEARRYTEAALAQTPGAVAHEKRLAKINLELASNWKVMKTPALAEEFIVEAVVILQRLYERFPQNPSHRYNLGMMLITRSDVACAQQRFDSALEIADRSVRMLQLLAEENPDNTLYAAAVPMALTSKATALAGRGELAAAADVYLLAARTMTELGDKTDSRMYRVTGHRFVQSAIEQFARAGDVERTRAELAQFLSSNLVQPADFVRAAKDWSWCAEAVTARGEPAAEFRSLALQHLKEAFARGFTDVAAITKVPILMTLAETAEGAAVFAELGIPQEVKAGDQ